MFSLIEPRPPAAPPVNLPAVRTPGPHEEPRRPSPSPSMPARTGGNTPPPPTNRIEGFHSSLLTALREDTDEDDEAGQWTTNAAGVKHSYKYGFGLVDALALAAVGRVDRDLALLRQVGEHDVVVGAQRPDRGVALLPPGLVQVMMALSARTARSV